MSKDKEIMNVQEKIEDVLSSNYSDYFKKLGEKYAVFRAVFSNERLSIETIRKEMEKNSVEEFLKHFDENFSSVVNIGNVRTGRIRILQIKSHGIRGLSFKTSASSDEFEDGDGAGKEAFEMEKNGHNIWQMKSGMGKTMTVEMIKWCFGKDWSNARGSFEHMSSDGESITRLLDGGSQERDEVDDELDGVIQEPYIEIYFSGINKNGEEHYYKFQRKIKGYITYKKNEDGVRVVEKIESIEDYLQVDSGKGGIKKNNEAHEYLESEGYQILGYDIDDMVFDGEKAKEMLVKTTDGIRRLQERLGEKTTERYTAIINDRLKRLEQQIKVEVRKNSSSSAKTDKIEKELDEAERKEKFYDKEYNGYNGRKKVLDDLYKDLRKQNDKIIEDIGRVDAVQKNALKANQVERKEIIRGLIELRNNIGRMSDSWISYDNLGMEKYKTALKENAIPEPIRTDVVAMCKKLGKCIICGEVLPKERLEKIEKELEAAMAPTPVHNYLQKFRSETRTDYDIKDKKSQIDDLIKKFKANRKTYSKLLEDTRFNDLNDKRREKEDEMVKNRAELGGFSESMVKSQENWKFWKDKRIAAEKSFGAHEEWRDIDDELKKILDDIEKHQEEVGDEIIKIVNVVLKQIINRIIGKGWSAKFSKDTGIEFIAGGYTDSDHGGMGFRIILGYVFVMILNTTGSFIVDTPSGNLDGAWVKEDGTKEEYAVTLAKFLSMNYDQVIAFCLPREIKGFGEELKPGKIQSVVNVWDWKENWGK